MQYFLSILNALSTHYHLFLQSIAWMLTPQILLIAAPVLALATLAIVAPRFTGRLLLGVLLLPFTLIKMAVNIVAAGLGFCFEFFRGLFGFSSRPDDNLPSGGPRDRLGFDTQVREDPLIAPAPMAYDYGAPYVPPIVIPREAPSPERVGAVAGETLAVYVGRLQAMQPSYSEQYAQNNIDLPDGDEKLCPISLEVMNIPVRVKELPQAFDYNHLIQLPVGADGIRTCPLTRERFLSTDIKPARDIKDRIEQHLQDVIAGHRGRARVG